MSDYGYGHCRHCDPRCEGGEEVYIGNGVREMDHGTERAYWSAGDCPACAEAERIADLIDAELRPLSEDGVIGWKRIGLTLAASIARGER